MTPVALNAALVACLGAGMADLALLNHAIVPELYGARSSAPRMPSQRPPARTPEPAPGPSVPAAEAAPSADARDQGPSELAERDRGAAELELVAVLEFAPSSHHLDSKARFRLVQKLALLRDAARIVIVGHADESGPEAFNDRLSLERAQATLRQLSARAISSERVELLARGERELLAHGNSRRVEIFRGGEP